MSYPFTLPDLKEFITKAQIASYANGKEFEKVPERPDFKELTFADGDWFYRDSFTGWFKSRGMEVVRYHNLPVWASLYGGGMLDPEPQLTHECFNFLKQALSVNNKGFDSFRGPVYMQLGDWEYHYRQNGGLKEFSGIEKIVFEKRAVFNQRINGGLIVAI
jgi:hypothetical protein